MQYSPAQPYLSEQLWASKVVWNGSNRGGVVTLSEVGQRGSGGDDGEWDGWLIGERERLGPSGIIGDRCGSWVCYFR